jgi:hypothetical protein
MGVVVACKCHDGVAVGKVFEQPFDDRLSVISLQRNYLCLSNAELSTYVSFEAVLSYRNDQLN